MQSGVSECDGCGELLADATGGSYEPFSVVYYTAFPLEVLRVIASSIKFRGLDCFQGTWSGFDSFSPITVIIGRNNTGKSRLLDMVQSLTQSHIAEAKQEVICKAVFDEEFLRVPFSSRNSGGDLSPRRGGPGGNHWDCVGQRLVGDSVEWQLEAGGRVEKVSLRSESLPEKYHEPAKNRLQEFLASVKCPLSEHMFRRLLADRDITPEAASNELAIGANGEGATNVIRRYITSSLFPEALIQEVLLNALDQIFGQDGNFTRIEIRHHDSLGDGTDEDWEVFVGEPKKGLIPLSRSGSGLKTVILVLLNLLVVPQVHKRSVSEFVFAFEELENNLHPALLRRLLKYLGDFVAREECRLFLTTHSNVALDFFGTRNDTQIIHVTHDGQCASAKTVATHFDHVGLLTELGTRPSDLLQANGVIWVEGPSDRIYINRFIELFSDGELREGRDYQCAFYGGSLLGRSAFTAPVDSDDTFANLLRLNHNIAVICDGDRTADSGTGSRIKGRVSRVKQQVDRIPSAFLWITEAKEIENYIPGTVWGSVYEKKDVPDPAKFDRFPTSKLGSADFVWRRLGRKSFDKCEFAMAAVGFLDRDSLASRFELGSKITSLVGQIRHWNV